jgi:hypothetical protein
VFAGTNEPAFLAFQAEMHLNPSNDRLVVACLCVANIGVTPVFYNLDGTHLFGWIRTKWPPLN